MKHFKKNADDVKCYDIQGATLRRQVLTPVILIMPVSKVLFHNTITTTKMLNLYVEVRDYIDILPVFFIVKIWGHNKFILRGQQLFWMEISTGPWRIFDQADTGPYTILYRKINGAMVNFTTSHRTFPGPVFP